MSLCLYSCLSYPACKLHLFCAALYRHLWPVWPYRIFPQYLINGRIFWGGWLNLCFDVLYNFRRRSSSFWEEFSDIFTQSACPSCYIEIKPKFSSTDWLFAKSCNIKFHKNSPSGSRVIIINTIINNCRPKPCRAVASLDWITIINNCNCCFTRWQ